MKNIVDKAAGIVGILAISIVTGALLLCIVYMLPVEDMQKHVAKDLELLQEEGHYTAFWDGVFIRMHPGSITLRTFFMNNRGMARDNYTDAIMLGNAVYQGETGNALEKAMKAQRYMAENEMPIDSLQEYLGEEKLGGETISYSRYWHGYLILLKPLLCFFSYSQIRILNVILQSILLAILCIKTNIKIGRRYSICLIGGVSVTFPFVIPFCMQYSTAAYIMLLSCISYVSYTEYWNKNGRYFYLFLLTGIVTSYMDFLTYPIITLGGLLIFSALLTGEKIWYNNEESGNHACMNCHLTRKPIETKSRWYIIKCSAVWSLGYFGMWTGKWIIATAVTGEDVIEDGIRSMLFRISSATETTAEGKITALASVFANFSSMTNIYYIIVFLLLLLFLIYVVKKQEGFRLKDILEQRHFAWIALYPLLWYAVIKNHSFDHSSFTYRAMFVTVFALMTMIVRSCEEIGRPDSDHLDKK